MVDVAAGGARGREGPVVGCGAGGDAREEAGREAVGQEVPVMFLVFDEGRGFVLGGRCGGGGLAVGG